MNLKEYIIVPTEKVILPYEDSTLILNKEEFDFLKENMNIIVGFYKSDSIANTIIVNHEDKVIFLSKYATYSIITFIREVNEEEIEVHIKGLHRTLILSTHTSLLDHQRKAIIGEATIFNPIIAPDAYKAFNDLRLNICDILASHKSTTNVYETLSLPPLEFFYFVIKELSSNSEYKQMQLEEENIIHGLQSIVRLFGHLNEKAKEDIDQEIYQKVKEVIEKNQREYLLSEKMKAIKKELDKSTGADDNNIEDEIKNHLHMPETVKRILLKEYEKIKHNNPLSSEYTVTKNYLTTSLSLPWGIYSNLSNTTLREAEDILNKEHYGLEEVKENILQYLATALQTQQKVVKVLLLVGPPGVGKTSIGASIAKCLKREFVFLSLASISDMADLTGHRRTYVGSYPGMIISKLIEAKVSNPLIFLDEVDKIKKSHNDPINILVALLDPTQNHRFTDNFLGYAFDISKAVFILTANTLNNIPDYLRSRMEVIEVDGYTLYEKIEISKKFLIPKLYSDLSVLDKEITITDEAIKYIIKHYTREMGVRHLQKLLNNIISKAIYINMKSKEEITDKRKIKKKFSPINISIHNIRDFTSNIEMDFNISLSHSEAIGLAWTSVGGDVLKIQAVFVESPKNEITITGNLGTVMQESAKVAYSLVKQSTLIKQFKLADNFFNTHSLHIHVPEGAIPKDGPSAGVTMYTAILLAVANQQVKGGGHRKSPFLAMTGEVSLSGEVLAIGGVKQKLLAALNYGINNVVLPKKNEIYVKKIVGFPFEEINIQYVSNVAELEKIIFPV